MAGSKRSKLTAKTADKFALYEESVQCPEADCDFFDRVYRKTYGRRPSVLREDFCGTAYLSCTWVRRRSENRAVAIDLHAPTLRYAREHHLRDLGERRDRVRLVRANVLDVQSPKAHVIAAMNFSYLVFKTRTELRAYFETARRSLARKGLFILDLYGGPEAAIRQEEETDYGDFVYVWDQDKFNPVTHEVVNYIHFRFPRGGGSLRRAFTYKWRLWTIPEIRELLQEAGFREVTVYWEGTDEDGDGNGVFRPTKTGDDSACWVAYITARP
jgi:SAM-dependent methyltransferase